MAKLHYYNETGEKIGISNVEELKALVAQGTITPNTTMDWKGRKGLAGQMPGLFPAPSLEQEATNNPETVLTKAPTVPLQLPTIASVQKPVASPVKKHPNPLVSSDSMAGISATLSSVEEYESYRKSILTPLQSPLPVAKMSRGYKLGLWLVAFFVILLPLVYFAAIIGLSIVGFTYCVTVLPTLPDALEQAQGRGAIGILAAFFFPPVAIGMLVLILLKPLFFSWGRKEAEFRIWREHEPLLFELVDHICKFVGAPVPKRIVVNCEVNAAARLNRGIWGALFGGNESDLVIGMPLVAGMTTSEFSGVLAHEFGHFTQSGSRRLTYIIGTVLNWFSHVYYHRDSMDDALITGSQTGHIVNMIFCLAVRGIIWLGRCVIWCLMVLGNLAAGFMRRQMEFDADEFEIQLGGSERFAVSSRKMIMLSLANQKTVNDLQCMLKAEQLADNYPVLIAVNSRIHNDDLQRISTQVIQEEKMGLFSSHPSTRDRIEAARKMNAPGVMHVDRPASLLFRNFLELSREVSLHFYREVIKLKVNPNSFKNIDATIDQFQREDLCLKAITNFFQRPLPPDWFLPLKEITLSTKDPQEMMSLLQEARNRQVNTAADVAAAERLMVALNLLRFTENQDRIEGGSELLCRMETLLPILTTIGNMQGEINEVVQRLNFVSNGLGMLQNMEQDKAQALWESILSESDHFQQFLLHFRNTFGMVPYPFNHGTGVTLEEFLVPTFNSVPTEPLEYFQGVIQLMGGLHTTYRLALGEAAAVALAVEDVLSLPRLPV